MSASVPTDEIYERYLRKAISEINELQAELLALADETHVPVLGSGHPLGDVFLLKHAPKPAEIAEGVAFFGRAGNALLKSLQRLGVDPLAIYGTNCLKFGTEEDEQAAPWLTRELHIVQPKLVVVMGTEAARVPRRADVPARRPGRGRRAGRRSAAHPHDRGPRDAGHRRGARRAGGEDRVLERLQGPGALVGAAAAVLSRRRVAALALVVAVLVAWDAGAGVLPDVGPLARRARRRARPHAGHVSRPAPRAAARPDAPRPRRSPACSSRAPCSSTSLGLGALFNVTKLLALTLIGYLFMQVFEALSWVVLIALIIPWVDALSVWRGPTEYVVSEQPSLFDRISIAFRLPGEEGSANIGPPDILFFALFLSTAARFGLRVGWTWTTMVVLLVVDADPHDGLGCDGPPRPPRDRDRLPAAERRPDLEGVEGAGSRALALIRPRDPARAG